MNDLTLNCFFKDKPEKIPKVQSSNHELMLKLKQKEIEKAQYDLFCVHNSICASFPYTSEFKELNYLLCCSRNILSQNIFELRTDDKKIYSQYGMYDKFDIEEKISKILGEESGKAFLSFYDTLYNYIDRLDYLKDSLLYLWILHVNDPDTYNKLFPLYFLDSIHSVYGSRYRVINGKAVMLYDEDLYEFNIDTLKRLLSIKSKSDELLEKYVKCRKEEIIKSYTNLSINNNSRPWFKYLYPGKEPYILKLDQGKICFEKSNSTVFFKPIIVNGSDLNAIRHRLDLHPICKCLQVVSNNSYTALKQFSKLLADCLLPYPQSKKLYVINVKAECDIEIIKDFIKHVLSHGNGSLCVIDKDLTLNEVCRNYKILDDLKYTRIYALFMKKRKTQLDPQLILNLSKLSTKTSSNINNKTTNNIQPILFQTTGTPPKDFRSNYIEYIDISNSMLDERINKLSSEECCWIRLYFSLYGLHLILKKQKSNHSFDLNIKLEPHKSKYAQNEASTFYALKEDYINCIVKSFTETYFTTSEKELETIKKQRKAKISQIKNQNKEAENIDDIITKEIADTPIHITFESNLKIYIQTYIDTQCKTSIIRHYNICVDDIYNAIYQQHTYGVTNLRYTGESTRYALKNFALKEPWSITKSKMEATNVNNVAEPDTEPIEAPKTATFDDPIDENLLDFLTKLNNAVMF